VLDLCKICADGSYVNFGTPFRSKPPFFFFFLSFFFIFFKKKFYFLFFIFTLYHVLTPEVGT
jgi:hypothetical protein